MFIMPWHPPLILSLRKIGEGRNSHLSSCVAGRVPYGRSAALFQGNTVNSFLCICFSKVALLITDGRQTTISSRTEPSPEQVSNAMKARGIEVMAMGIGQVDPIELRKYVSSPPSSYIMIVEDFSDLDDSVLKQAVRLCPRKLQRNCLVTTDSTSSGISF